MDSGTAAGSPSMSRKPPTPPRRSDAHESTRRESRHRPRHRTAVRRRGRPRLHHRPAPGRARGRGEADRQAGYRRSGRRLQSRGPRSPVRSGEAREGPNRCPLRQRRPRLIRAAGAISEEQFDTTFGSNVKGLLFTVQKALPLFKDGGSIILNASIAGSKGLEALSVYNATKAAVRSFARSWTVDLKARKIRVNAISPGPIDTPGVNNLGLTAAQIEEFKRNIVAAVPLGRMGKDDEIAKAAL